MRSALGCSMYQITDGWLESVIHVPSPNTDSRPKNCDISLLVIHNISLPPGIFGGSFVEDLFTNNLDLTVNPYFQNLKDLKVSCHLFLKRSGEIIQFVSFNERAWHAGLSVFNGRSNCNDYSIGIELEGTDKDEYTDYQYKSLVSVTSPIMSAYPAITLDRIVGHSDISQGRKTDPGNSFDWIRYKRELNLMF